MLVSALFICIFLAALSYFLGHITYSLYCPSTIKDYPRQETYVDRVHPLVNGDADRDALMARSHLAAKWAEADRDTKNAILPMMFVLGFGALLSAAYLLGVAVLAEFATR